MTNVVVIGLGAITPLGVDVPTTWNAALRGESGVRTLHREWTQDLPVRFAGQLPEGFNPAEVVGKKYARRWDRTQQLAVLAAREAWQDAGSPTVDKTRLAVVVGTGIGGIGTILSQNAILQTRGVRGVSPFTVPMIMPNGAAACVGLDLGAKAGVHSPSSACATGAEALHWARMLIVSGMADVVVAGGAEATLDHILPMAAFDVARTLSRRNDNPAAASRPWTKTRDGFVMGEGVGIVVLASDWYAREHASRVYARFAGSGMTSDAHDMVQPHPNGEGGVRAIELALTNAGLHPQDVGHVNCHATSTGVGDIAELEGVRSAIGTHAVLTGTKSMTGHLLGAAGAVESIFTILAVHHGIVPPTINHDDPIDEVADFDVATSARAVGLTAAINDSFGFGGHNASLVFTSEC